MGAVSAGARYAIRVVKGDLTGSLFPIDERLDIGRSAVCDVQLLEDGVSKAHAAIVEKEEDVYAIVDLLSRNGLYVNGERLSHSHLKLGDRVRIGATEFVFELLRGSTEALATPRLDSEETFGETLVLPHDAVDDPERAAAVEAAASYPGDLLADIVAFRGMRMTLARKGLLPENLQQRYALVEERLGVNAAVRRFACRIEGKIVFAAQRERELATTVVEVAVDRARVRVPGPHSDGELCWLSVFVDAPDGPRPVVFTARVTDVLDGEIVIAFSGAPSFAERNRDFERKSTDELPAQGDDD
jgi:hypothetical protein